MCEPFSPLSRQVIDEDFLTPHDVIEDADHFGGRAGGTEPSELICSKCALRAQLPLSNRQSIIPAPASP
jgi:hypothetical protein